MPKPKDLHTIAAANGIATDSTFRAVTPPIYLSSTFAFNGYEKSGAYEYTRTANPSRDMLADTLAKLEGGAGAVVVCSGMAAVDVVLAQTRKGGLVVAPHDCYGGTYRLLEARQRCGQIEVAFVDQGDAAALSAAFARSPALVLIETPSNPLMRVVDIKAIAAQAKHAGARVAVDNTFLSPALQRPISLGADFVIHSTTKYLNGHSDVVGGAVIAAEQADAEALAEWVNVVGVTGAPYFGGGFHGQRLNKMYLENVGEEAILKALDEILGRYARERQPQERFGDFAIRAGYVAEVKEGRHFND